MFGDKFYKRLKKLMPWQQTVFCLALSERMYPNYCLYAASTGKGDSTLIRNALDVLWQYETEKSMKVDLSSILEEVEAIMPNPTQEDCYGAYPALDACITLASAYNSIVFRLGDEAFDASQTSIGSVVGFLEIQRGEEIPEEELYEDELIVSEMEFQVEILNLISQPRDNLVIQHIRELSSQDGVSNLGISLT